MAVVKQIVDQAGLSLKPYMSRIVLYLLRFSPTGLRDANSVAQGTDLIKMLSLRDGVPEFCQIDSLDELAYEIQKKFNGCKVVVKI